MTKIDDELEYRITRILYEELRDDELIGKLPKETIKKLIKTTEEKLSETYEQDLSKELSDTVARIVIKVLKYALCEGYDDYKV